MPNKLQKSDAEWRAELTPEQYHILREKGTERPFTGALVNNHADGFYHCAACDAPLFKSGTKYESGFRLAPASSSPSPPKPSSSTTTAPSACTRVEVTCATCGGHLGHVFPDGPNPTGHRFCINSASLKFEDK